MKVVETTPRTERAPMVIIYRPDNNRRYSSGAGISTVIQQIEIEIPEGSDLTGEWLISATSLLPNEGAFVLGSGRLSLTGDHSPVLRRTLYQPSNGSAEQLLRQAYGKTVTVTPSLGKEAGGTLLSAKGAQVIIRQQGSAPISGDSSDGVTIIQEYQKLSLPPDLEVRPTHSLSFGVRVTTSGKFQGKIWLEATHLDWKVLYRGFLTRGRSGEATLFLTGEALINNNSGLDIKGAEIVLADARSDAEDEDTRIEVASFAVAAAGAPRGGRQSEPEQEKVGTVNTFALPELWDLPSGSSQGISFLPGAELPVQLQPLLKRSVWWGEEARYQDEGPWVVRESMFLYNPLEGSLPSGSLDVEEKHPTHDLRIVTSKSSVMPEVSPGQTVRVTLSEIGDITAVATWAAWNEEASGEDNETATVPAEKISADQPLSTEEKDDGANTVEVPGDYEGDRHRLILCQVVLESHQSEPVALLFLQSFGRYRLINSNVKFEPDELTGLPSYEIKLKPGVKEVIAFIVETPLEDEDD